MNKKQRRKTKEEVIKELMDDPELRKIVRREIDLEIMQTERLLNEQTPHEFSEEFNKHMEQLFTDTKNTEGKEVLLEDLEEKWKEMIEERTDSKALSKQLEDYRHNKTASNTISSIENIPIHPKAAYDKKRQTAKQLTIGIACCFSCFLIVIFTFYGMGTIARPETLVKFFPKQDKMITNIDEITTFDGTPYEPTWLPRGFEKVSESMNDTDYVINYEKDTGHYLSYSFSSIYPETSTLVNDTEKYQIKLVSGITYYYIEQDNTIKISWFNNNIKYTLFGNTDLDTLMKITQNVKIKEN